MSMISKAFALSELEQIAATKTDALELEIIKMLFRSVDGFPYGDSVAEMAWERLMTFCGARETA